MVTAETLCHYSHFSKLTEDGRNKLAAIAEEKTFPANATLFLEYDPAESLFLIVDGKIELQYELGSGEMRVIDTLANGELVVWSALVDPYRCTAIGKTTRETHVIAFDAAKLRQLCEEDRKFGHQLLQQVAEMLSGRLEGARVQLANVG